MKKVGLIGGLAILIVFVIAVFTAGHMGQTNPARARGTVVLPDNLKEMAKGIRTLYIIAQGTDRPMPLGAFRETLSDDPSGVVYEFVLTADNMPSMMGEVQWPATFKLKARLDQDGAAGPDRPGDLVGEVYPVKLGQEGVEIRIDHVVQ